jgi:two-component system heavy metal sensor histidine kinase CusS
MINADDQTLYSRAEILASRTEISPLIIPLPNSGEQIRIDYLSYNIAKNLFISDKFPKDINIKTIPAVISLNDQRIAVIESVIDKNPSERIRVYLSRAVSPLENNINFLSRILIISNLISLFIASILSYFLSGYMLKPVNDIIISAKNINIYEKTEQLKVPQTNDEVQRLAETVNEMLQRIERSMKEQNNFFASASHELKTPLTILQTEIEVSLKSDNLSPEIIELLNSQLDEVKRLSRLIEDFLLVTQLKNKSLQLRFNKVELDEIIFEVIKKLNKLLHLSGKKLELKFDENIDDFNLIADKDKLINVLINLIENAVKYASSGTDIILSVKKAENTGQFIIELENRIDKPVVNIERLSDEFYRSDVLKDGYGLGLWISNKIINTHKGTIAFYQEGNSFIVKLILPVK